MTSRSGLPFTVDSAPFGRVGDRRGRGMDRDQLDIDCLHHSRDSHSLGNSHGFDLEAEWFTS